MCTLPAVKGLVYFLPGKPQSSPHPPTGLPNSRLRAKAAWLLVVGQLDPLPRDFAGRPLVRTAAVHRVQSGGAGGRCWEVGRHKLPNQRTLYPASVPLHTKNSCRQAQGPAAPPGAGSSTGFWAMLLRENSCTMEKMAEAVTADEASILQVGASFLFQVVSPMITHFQDFFALQADKHGPEILVRLQSIGGKPLARLETKGVAAAVPSGACGRGEAEKPVNDPPNLPPAPTSVVAPPERNVSVIQRTPNVERPDPPKIILQRRVLDIPEHVRQEILAGIGSTDERGSPVTVKGVKGLSDPLVRSQMGRRGAQKRKVPPGQRTNQQQSDHLVCQVCGERAGKHSYYGGQVPQRLVHFPSTHADLHS